MLRLPRKWVMVVGLLAAAPSTALAGPFDFFKANNKTTVSAQSERTNQQVAEEIAGALKKARFKGFDITIDYKEGVATLSGKISDSGQRAHATKVVSTVEGVQSVDNNLQVLARPAKKSAVRQASATTPAGQPQPIQQVAGQRARSNQQVAQSIANGLVSAGLGEQDVQIKFSDGTAKLIGSLDNDQQAIAACRLAAAVPEVRKVQANLTAGGKRFDPSVLNRVQQTAYAPGSPLPTQLHPQMQQIAAQQQMVAQQQMLSAPPQAMGPIHQTGLHGHGMYNSPNLPEYAWPSYAPYDNYGAVTYPSQYDASAWPYIGPFYPYPQVPLGWREATLSWDDGYWNLEFEDRTDKWWWFLNPENWD